MPQSKILVDSGFLFALYSQGEDAHPDAKAIADLYDGQFTIPYVVLTEVAYLFRKSGAAQGVIQFLDELIKANYHYEILTPNDLKRARDIMAEYEDTQFDFVDCCIMALSERLNISQICTLDQRDFSIFRPKHVEFFEILP